MNRGGKENEENDQKGDIADCVSVTRTKISKVTLEHEIRPKFIKFF